MSTIFIICLQNCKCATKSYHDIAQHQLSGIEYIYLNDVIMCQRPVHTFLSSPLTQNSLQYLAVSSYQRSNSKIIISDTAVIKQVGRRNQELHRSIRQWPGLIISVNISLSSLEWGSHPHPLALRTSLAAGNILSYFHQFSEKISYFWIFRLGWSIYSSIIQRDGTQSQL